MKLLHICAAFILLFIFASDTLPAEKKQKQDQPLSKEEVQKLKDIAGIIAGEIARRNIKAVTVMDFTDIKGKPSKKGKTVTAEFRKQIEAAGKSNFTIDGSGSAVITGVFLPFVGGDKWKLDIKVLSTDNRLITSYSAFYRKTKGIKK